MPKLRRAASPKRKGERRRHPYGFIPKWRPQKETRVLLGQVRSVLAEYKNQLPLTIRQILYRLMGVHGYPKDGYGKLLNMMNFARRARVIDMDAIRDDKFVREMPFSYDSLDDFWTACRQSAERIRFDRQAGQKRRLVVWCEAAGMVPQLARVCKPFGVPVMSGGGFDSTTAKHDAARQFADYPTTVLHIGDLDKHGLLIYQNLVGDISAFVNAYGRDIGFCRLAVTSQQATKYNLPESPEKPGTFQAEALDPKDLADIVRTAIEVRMDLDLFRKVERREKRARQKAVRLLGQMLPEQE